MNVVVTGASRGIGFELSRVALEKGARVLAIARKIDSPGIKDLKSSFGEKLQTFAADLRDPTAPDLVADELKKWDRVDLLINNAGVFRKAAEPEDFVQSYQLNSIAPFLMIKALTPWLKKSGAPKSVNVTSLMGSIADNSSGGYYAYRSSKAALNMINKSLSRDLEWLTTIVVHPGWVKTEMGGAGAPVEPVDSAMGIWQVMEKAGRGQSGGFYNYTGEELPW